jgi:hypothetical protein
MTVGQLLDLYDGILAELRRRGLVRTNNAPHGDLAEYVAALAYGGQLAPNSAKSYDLTAADGRRIQVKVRVTRGPGSDGFSPVRSFDFDAAVFILVAAGTVRAAHEWTPEDVKAHGRPQRHVNGYVVTGRQLPTAGTDVTPMMRAAWDATLALAATLDAGDAPV